MNIPAVQNEQNSKRKREAYLNRLLEQNIGQKTGILSQKGYLPADFLQGGYLKLPGLEDSKYGNGWQDINVSRSLAGGYELWSRQNDVKRTLKTRNSQVNKIHMTMPQQSDVMSIQSNQLLQMNQNDFSLKHQFMDLKQKRVTEMMSSMDKPQSKVNEYSSRISLNKGVQAIKTSDMPTPESSLSPRKATLFVPTSKPPFQDEHQSYLSAQDQEIANCIKDQGIDEQSPMSLRKSPNEFQQKLEQHRKQQELLNMPMQLETKNLVKFERQFVNLVSKKKNTRNARYNQSIDFVGQKIDLNPKKSPQKYEKSPQIKTQLMSKEYSLPSINQRSGIFDFMKNSSKYTVNLDPGKPMMSVREKKFQMNKTMIKEKLRDERQENLKNSQNQFLQSNHYKFNRLKQGDWGSQRKTILSTQPLTTQQSSQLPQIIDNINISAANLDDTPPTNLILMRNFKPELLNPLVQIETLSVFDKEDLVGRDMIQNPVDEPSLSPKNLNEYQSQSQERLENIKTILIQNKQKAHARNSSNVSVETDRTRKQNQNDSGFVSKHNQYQSFQNTDPDRLTTGVLNLTMNIESGKSMRLTKDRMNNQSTQNDQYIGIQESLLSNDKTASESQFKKKNLYASIDNIELKRLMEREERQEFNLNYKSSKISINIDEKVQVRRQREQIQYVIQEIQIKIKQRKKENEAKRKENYELMVNQENQVEMYKKLCNIINMSSMQFKAFQTDKSLAFLQKPEPFKLQSSLNHDSRLGEIHTSDMSLQQQNSIGYSTQQTEYSTRDIHGFYKFIYENDLQNAKKKALFQIESLRSLNQFNMQEQNILLLENKQLKQTILRYKKMIKEIKEQESFKLDPIVGQTSNFVRNLNKSENLEMSIINNQLYKYGENKQDQDQDTKSSFYGNMTSHTPGGKSFQTKTHMSFVGGRGPLIMSLRQVETITMRLNTIFKQTKLMDSVVMLMQMIVEVFKPQKATLFVIDQDLQEIMFKKGERSQNYKKVMLTGSNLIYGIFGQESEFCGPIFKNMDQAGNHMMNNKVIMIPLKSGKKTVMTLQVIYNEKLKVGRAGMNEMGSSPQKNTKNNSALSRRNDGGASNSSKISRQKSSRHSLLKGSNTGISIPGWNKNDIHVIRILSGYIKANVDYFCYQTVIKQKVREIKRIIDFSSEIMHIKTYRDLAQKVKQNCETIIGFQQCSVFFHNKENDELFAVTKTETQGELTTNASEYAKELYFPEDEVIIFPSTIGMTGEMHQKVGFNFKNNFGQLIAVQDDDQTDTYSQFTGNTISRRSSTMNYLYGAKPKTQAPKTKLELIKEDTEEHQYHKPSKLSVHESMGHSPNMSILNVMLHQSEAHSPRRGGDSPDPSRNVSMPGGGLTNVEKNQHSEVNFSQAMRKVESSKAKQQVMNIPEFTGNIMNLNGDIVEKQKKKKKVKVPQYTASYVPDIDNFLGVQDLKNFAIGAITDDSFKFGVESVGILQVYNKVDGKNITIEDIAKLKWIGRFIGALSQKARYITQSLTLVIGLTQNIHFVGNILGGIDTSPGLGSFGNLQIPVDIIKKQLGTEE